MGGGWAGRSGGHLTVIDLGPGFEDSVPENGTLSRLSGRPVTVNNVPGRAVLTSRINVVVSLIN